MAKPTKAERLAETARNIGYSLNDLSCDVDDLVRAIESNGPADDFNAKVFDTDQKPFLVAFLNQARDSAEHRWHAIALERLADMVERMP